MTTSRQSTPPPDIGSLSAVLAPSAGERRGVQVGLAVAAALHAVIFAITWPSFAGGERAVVSEKPPRIFVLQQVEFEQPDPVQVQLPEPPRRIVTIPDATPDAPEPPVPRVSSVIPVTFSEPPLPRIDPPPPPVTPSVIRANVDIDPPDVLLRVEPRYPPAALAARVGGTVVLDFLISPDGSVRDVTVLRGGTLGMTEAAVEAALQWRFSPSTIDDKPVSVRYVLTIRFTPVKK